MDLKKPPQILPVTIATFLLFKDRYRVDPTYQRAPGVWETSREQYLIDSILRGYGIPLIFIHKRDGHEYIVDGQQRLLTIWKFAEDKLELSEKHSGDIISENGGATKYTQLTPEYQNRFASYVLGVAYLEDYTDEEIRSTFRRLQSGKDLSPGEKLNAFPGTIVPAMRTLAADEFFKKTVTLGLGRYKGYYLAAMLLMLEHSGITSTSPNYVFAFFDANKTLKPGSAKYKKVERVLSFLTSSFGGPAPELATQAWIVSTYLLASYLLDNYAMQTHTSSFRDFIVQMYQDVATVASSPKPDAEIIKFVAAISQGTNNQETIKFRHEVLVRRFLEKYRPAELDEDRIFKRAQKVSIFRRDGSKCQYPGCGKALAFGDAGTHYHHVGPYSRGGPTEIANGLLVCSDCHLKKIHGHLGQP